MQTSLKMALVLISSLWVNSSFADSEVTLSICNALNYNSVQYPNGYRIIYTLAPKNSKDVDMYLGDLSSSITTHSSPSNPTCKVISFSTTESYPVNSRLIIYDEETADLLWYGTVVSMDQKTNDFYRDAGITVETTPSQLTLR